jgi:glycosyltransferase involved in cell wall biosynthesis
MAAISVVVCCANAADTLEPALRSAAWADEIIVVDSGSTDATGEIARRLAQRYVVEPWRGYSQQKAFGAGLARHEWVFLLDGDEEITPALAEEIMKLPATAWAQRDVFWCRRRNWVCGRVVRAWWPDTQSRLIHRDRVRHADEPLHDARLAQSPDRVGQLRGWIEHKRHSTAGFTDYFSGRRMDDRLMLVAKEMHERGQRCHWWDLVFRPPLAFVKFYIFKRGFLDGLFGWMIAQKAAASVQLKYAALWAVEQERRRPASNG